jgi:hypothetical protein
LRQARKRKGSDKESEGEDLDNPDFEDVAEIPRPMGQKKQRSWHMKRKLRMIPQRTVSI